MTAYLVISLPILPYTHTVYDCILGDLPANITVYTPYMTAYLVISLPILPYTRLHTVYIWLWPTLTNTLNPR